MTAISDNSNKRAAQPRAAASRAGLGGNRARLVLAAVLGALAAACSVGLLATSAWLISRSAQRPPVLYLMAPAAVVQAFGLGRAPSATPSGSPGTTPRSGCWRRAGCAPTTPWPGSPRPAWPDYRSGDLLARLVADIDSLADRWLRVRLPFAAAALAGAGAVAVVGVLSPPAGLVLAATLVVSALAAPAVAIALSRAGGTGPGRRCEASLAAATMELLDGAAELAAFGADGARLAAVQAKGARVGEATRPCGLRAGSGGGGERARGGAAVCGRALLRRPRGPRRRPRRACSSPSSCSPRWPRTRWSPGSRPPRSRSPGCARPPARVADVLRRPAPVAEPPAPAALPGPPYDLAARGLTAGWAPGRDVLRDVWFDVPAGSRTAITGPSGSGKTTLAMVLLRFLDYSAGVVTLGGRDLRTLDPDAVRSVIGLCEQDAHVFDSTLEANLRLAKPSATADELRAALARARLLAWADSLPRGLATPVGEHGARLSGGQRQRLALARVLLADFPVVILDEPAEHLDEATAAELTSDLLSAVAGRTVLLITHRPVAPGHVDQVLRLDGGLAPPQRPGDKRERLAGWP